jgi:hypothetical protein
MDKLRNEAFINLHSQLNIIGKTKSKKMVWAGHVARMVEIRNAYTILARKRQRKRLLVRPRRVW